MPRLRFKDCIDQFVQSNLLRRFGRGLSDFCLQAQLLIITDDSYWVKDYHWWDVGALSPSLII